MGRIYRERTTRRTLANMDRRIKAQGSASVLARSGLSVPEEGVTQVDGTLHVLGDFIADGKVSNEALESPVLPDVRMANATNFSLTTTLSEKVSIDVSVPDGFTRLLAKVDGFIYANNPNTTGGSDGNGGDAISARTDVGGWNSAWMPEGVSGNGGFSTQSSSLAVLIENLTLGATIHMAELGMSNYQTIAANVNNRAFLSALLIWLR